MCYSVQASIAAFVVGMSLSLGLTQQADKNKQIFGWFFAFVSLMQLFDAYFWLNPENADVSKIAMIFNHAQPLVLAFLVNAIKKQLSVASKLFAAVYLFVITVYSLNLKITNTVKDSSSGDSLNWTWNHGKFGEAVYIYFTFVMAYIFYSELDQPYNKIAAFYTVASFALSVVKYEKIKSVGRFWCFIACFIPLLVYFI